MKNSIKRKLIAVCSVSAIFVVISTSVFAAPTVRPMPGSAQASNVTTSSGTSASDETGDYKSSNITRAVPTAIPVSGDGQVSIVTDTEKAAGEKKSVSVGGMIGWLLLSILINAAISFWIANRFYKLSKKDSHVTAEIRALRRDVEEKFLQNVGGFAEQETDISNSNEDYSMEEDGITMPRRQSTEKRSQAEEDEMLRQWESRMNAGASRQKQTRRETEYESSRRKKYQPTRKEIEPDTEDYEDEDDGKSGIKSKAKEILGDIFPFKEE